MQAAIQVPTLDAARLSRAEHANSENLKGNARAKNEGLALRSTFDVLTCNSWWPFLCSLPELFMCIGCQSLWKRSKQ